MNKINKIIAYLGLPGSYSHQAAIKYFGKKAEVLACSSFDEIISKTKEGIVSYGIIPVSNSLVGQIADNYQLIKSSDLAIVGELDLPIHHCLAGTPDSSVDQISQIYSHPSALAQCKKYLEKYPTIQKIVYSDTASAAKYVQQHQDSRLTAICSRSAAKIYDLKIIATNIEDHPNNITHFKVVTRPELAKYRSLIDTIDKQIMRLVSKRQKICNEVGIIKKYLNLPVYNPAREKEVIKNVQSYSDLDKSFVKKLYSVIISHCRDVQN